MKILECSNCGGEIKQEDNTQAPVFCPKCGADRVTFKDVTPKEEKPASKKPFKPK